MKKILLISLTVLLGLLILTSCGGEKTSIKVAVLNGTTGFGMAQLMEQNENGQAKNNYTFSVESEGADIIPQLVKGEVDIAALPTNAASVVYNKTNGGVKIVALNTLGVLYVVENGESVKSINDLEGKTIYCPAQNPEFILKYLLKENNINATVDTTFSKPADLRTAVASGELKDKNIIAVLPEPMVTMAKASNSSLKVALDLTQEWSKVSDNQLVQGCIVVRTEFLNNNQDAVNKFLKEYKKSIEFLQENVDDAASLVVKHGIFGNENVAKQAIPKCNVTYIDGKDMKSAMESFLNVMFNTAPASIGGKLPNDDFYYEK